MLTRHMLLAFKRIPILEYEILAEEVYLKIRWPFSPDRWLFDKEQGGKKLSLKAGYSIPFRMSVQSCGECARSTFFEKMPAVLDTLKPSSRIPRSPVWAYVSPQA